MASETFANRAELRRRLLARMGSTTDTTVYSQATEQLNEFLREAAQMVRDACEWKDKLVDFAFTTGTDEAFYNYPANTGPGDIVRVARWDDDAKEYVQLDRRVILPILENDPDWTGDDEIATRDKPLLWEDSAQVVSGVAVPAIKLNPLPDAVYTMKMQGYLAASLTDETTPSAVDADCIVLLAYAEILDSDGREKLAQIQRAKAEKRIGLLAGAQRTGQIIRRGRKQTAALRFGVRFREPLNFDTSLSRMPPP